MRKISIGIFLMLIIGMLTACDGEIHDRMLIRGIGIDYEGGFYKISVRCENVSKDKEELLNSEGETVFDALSALSLKSGSRQMYADSYYIIFGKETLKAGIESCLDFFIRYFKAMPTEQLFVAEGRASDVLSLKKDDELIPSDFIRNLKNSSKNSGKTISINLMELISLTDSPAETALIPRLSIKDEELLLDGAYVLKNYKAVSLLEGDAITGLLIARGEIGLSSVTAESDGYKFTLELNKADPKLTLDTENNKAYLGVKVKASIASMSFNGTIREEKLNEMEKAASMKIEQYIHKALTSYKKEADLLGINYILYRENKLAKMNLKDIEINVKAETEIDKTGQEERPDTEK